MNSPGHDDDALWSAYLDGRLDAEARARAEARLRASAADREALESMRAADQQLRATPVPDPGAAYWRDFSARVEARVRPRDPARVYEKLVAWFVNGERVRWMRAAGALAGLTLVTYIGMRGFRPAEVRMPSAPHSVRLSPPQAAPDAPQPTIVVPPAEHDVPPAAPGALHREKPADKPHSAPTLRDAVQGAEQEQQKEPRVGSSPGAASTPGADRDEGASKKAEVDVRQPPTPQRSYDAVPSERARLEEGSQALSKPPGTFAIEPLVGQGRTDKLADDQSALKLDLQGGRGRSATDSIASLLARSLRKDSSPAGPTVRDVVKSLNESKRANEAPKSPSPPPPVSEVDRLLQLADTAEPHATDPAIRPHVETIALRLAEFAREDPRAATRARALMRNLAASSTTPGERATWEERLRQLPN